jgi:eukaryotic translation initiation factor 2C
MNKLDLKDDPAVIEVSEGLRTWHICIKKRDNINLKDLLVYSEGISQSTQKALAVSKIQDAHRGMVFLNALLRHAPSKRFQTGQGGKSTTYFDHSNEALQQCLAFNRLIQAWSGVYQSASVRFGRLTVNVDIATAIYIQPDAPFTDYVASLCGPQIRPYELQDWFQREIPGAIRSVLNKLKGVGFRTKHLKDDAMKDAANTYLTKYVWKIEVGKTAANHTFDRRIITVGRDGKPVQALQKTTVRDYFRDVYKIELRYPNLPLVEATQGRGVKIPMELCFVDKSERYKPLLQGEETAEFLRYATVRPDARKNKILRNVGRLAWHENKDLKDFKVAIKAQPIEATARVLPCPEIHYDQNHTVSPKDGRWNLGRDRNYNNRIPQFIKSKPIDFWGILCFSTPGRRSGSTHVAVQLIQDNLPKVLFNHGIKIGRSQSTRYVDVQGDMLRTIKEFMSEFSSRMTQYPQLIVIILPSDHTGLYSDIKRACEVEIGVVSQCLVAGKIIEKGLDQYLSNVAMKVNAKMGGISAMVKDSWFDKHAAMILGADISRPRHGEEGTQTFVAVSGSYDPYGQRYTAITRCQNDEDGIILDFEKICHELIERYISRQRNKTKPSSILYFRDGISEDRYDEVLSTEYAALKSKLNLPERQSISSNKSL